MANPSSSASTKHPPSRFRVERMVRSDFSMMITPSHRRGGDLATPPISPLCWHVEPDEDDEALRRLEYSTEQQRRYFDLDPTAHLIKAVTADGEIVSMARWNFFPRGYDFGKTDPGDILDGLTGRVHDRMNVALWRDMWKSVMEMRNEWNVRNKPCWSKPRLVLPFRVVVFVWMY